MPAVIKAVSSFKCEHSSSQHVDHGFLQTSGLGKKNCIAKTANSSSYLHCQERGQKAKEASLVGPSCEQEEKGIGSEVDAFP